MTNIVIAVTFNVPPRILWARRTYPIPAKKIWGWAKFDLRDVLKRSFLKGLGQILPFVVILDAHLLFAT